MKYLKTFEAKGTHIITEVDFTGGGDGVHAIYIDGNLHKYGDYYHDKIEEWVEKENYSNLYFDKKQKHKQSHRLSQ